MKTLMTLADQQQLDRFFEVFRPSVAQEDPEECVHRTIEIESDIRLMNDARVKGENRVRWGLTE